MLRNSTIFILFIVGLLHHHHGMNDWFSPTFPNDALTPAQLANEIIAAVFFVGAMIIAALAPKTKKETKQD